VRTPQGIVRSTPKLATRPFAGPFRTLEASGRRRTRELDLTTRHRFDATGITESWSVRRRRGHHRYTVSVLTPSWGATGSIAAQLHDGRIIALAPGARVRLRDVARFRVLSDRGGYWLTPRGRVRGAATVLTVAPQRSVPAPGPTLRITLAEAARLHRVSFEARISPLAERP
jgi:hypothetical protein